MLLVMLAARDGVAQSSAGAPRVFAGASLAGNIDKTVSSPAQPTGGALAVGLAFGTTFADRWSVQVEGEWPTSDQIRVHQGFYQTCPPEGCRYGELVPHVQQTTSRTPTVAVLVGVHWRLPKRVDIAFQFGPCFRYEQRDYEDQWFVNGIFDHSSQYSENRWRSAVSLGVEAAVALTPRVAVVGQLRVHGGIYQEYGEFDGVVRPAIGVRVRF
jgi:hypothetical protein